MESIISVGSITDYDVVIGECCHINAEAIVKAGSKVDALIRAEVGQLVENRETEYHNSENRK